MSTKKNLSRSTAGTAAQFDVPVIKEGIKVPGIILKKIGN